MPLLGECHELSGHFVKVDYTGDWFVQLGNIGDNGGTLILFSQTDVHELIHILVSALERMEKNKKKAVPA